MSVLTKEQLDEIIKELKQRYTNAKARTIVELAADNKDLDISLLNTATKMYYGKTRGEYLIIQGILEDGRNESGASIKKSDTTSISKGTEISFIEIRDESLSQNELKKGMPTVGDREEDPISPMENELLEIVEPLKEKYAMKKAATLTAVMQDNPDINVSGINPLSKNLYGMTAREYLISIGVIQVSHDAPEIETERIKLGRAMTKLRERYADGKKAKNLTDVLSNNKDLHLSSLNQWTKTLFGKTAKEYLIDNDIIEECEVVELDPIKELEKIVDPLKRRYAPQKAETLTAVMQDNPDINVSRIHPLTKKLYNMSAKEYLISIGVIKEIEQRDDNVLLAEILSKLKKEYATNPASSLSSIDTDISGVSSTRLSQLIRKVNKEDPIDFLRKMGIVKRKNAPNNQNRFEKITNALAKRIEDDRIESECHDIVNVLIDRKRSTSYDWSNLEELVYLNEDLDIYFLIENAEKVFGVSAAAYLEALGIIGTRACHDGLDEKTLTEQYVLSNDDAVSYNQYSSNNDAEAIKDYKDDIGIKAKEKYSAHATNSNDLNQHGTASTRAWDKHEAALLLEAYLLVNEGKIDRKAAISNVSKKLRKRAELQGEIIDDVFRNEAGITFQMYSMESAYLGYTVRKPATKLFSEIVELRENDRVQYDKLLHEIEEELNNNPDFTALNMRLSSMAKVYDNVHSFSIERIKEMLNMPIETDTLRMILDNAPWVIKLGEDTYSFSKDAELYTKTEDYDTDSFYKVLMMRYQNGMRCDSIDLENFRDTYVDIIGDNITLSDEALVDALKKCGVLYKDRIFPAEGIINDTVKEKLLNYIENSFSSGKKVLYYKAIYSDLSDEFAYCFNLADPMMLKPYLEFVCESGKYSFFDDFCSKESNVEIDHTAEIEEYLLSVGKPLSYGEIYSGLSHISQNIIYSEIKQSSCILMNEKEHYFHCGIFELSSEETEQISGYINYEIQNEGYCIWSRIYETIKKNMTLFIENNAYLSSLGIRNAVAKKLVGRFNFDGEVICAREQMLSMSDVFRLYGQHHSPFSDVDLYEFSKEINGGIIYFSSLAETTVRVGRNLFVASDEVKFDVDATDKALSTYLTTGYIPIQDIDSYLVFPNVGYEWNTFMLESYLLHYSKEYTLCNNGQSLNNVAGAVIKKGTGFDEFEIVCADILANSDIVLNKSNALNYLATHNMLTRRSYKKIEEAITKAKQIRNKKG